LLYDVMLLQTVQWRHVIANSTVT